MNNPHFDDDRRFIHRCHTCGEHAVFGFGVNLRDDKLGTWFCGKHRPSPRRQEPVLNDHPQIFSALAQGESK